MDSNDDSSIESDASALIMNGAVGLLTLAGVILIGLILAYSAASGPEDDRYAEQERFIEEGGGLFPNGERRSLPATTIPRPPANDYSNTVDVEYRADSAESHIEIRHTGRCEDDAFYSVDETDEVIRIAAFTRNDSGCDRVEWVSVRLNNTVGDRVIVNAAAGLTARPVIR